MSEPFDPTSEKVYVHVPGEFSDDPEWMDGTQSQIDYFADMINLEIDELGLDYEQDREKWKETGFPKLWDGEPPWSTMEPGTFQIGFDEDSEPEDPVFADAEMAPDAGASPDIVETDQRMTIEYTNMKEVLRASQKYQECRVKSTETQAKIQACKEKLREPGHSVN